MESTKIAIISLLLYHDKIFLLKHRWFAEKSTLKTINTNLSSLGQSCTKVLRQFRKSNAFEQRTEFCTGMKTFFSSVITPPPPNNVAKRFVNVYLFPTLKMGKGEAIFPEIIEQNSNQGKRVVILMCLNNFCP